MSKLNQLKTEGKIALWLDFKQATLKDLSGNGNDSTVAGTPYWTNTRTGKAIGVKADTDGLTVADSASVRVTEGVLIFTGNFTRQLASKYLFYKAAGAGSALGFYVSSTTAIGFTAGGTASTLTANIIGSEFVAVRFKGGEKPDFYINGSYVGTGNNALPAITAAATVNYLLGSNGASPLVKFTGVIILNTRNVSDQEISQIYDELSTERGAGDPKTSNYHFFPDIHTEPYLKLAFDTTKTADGKLADLSGNGKNGTITAPMILEQKDGVRYIRGNGVTNTVDFGTPLGNGITKATIELACDLQTALFAFGGTTLNSRIQIAKAAGNIYAVVENASASNGSAVDTTTGKEHWVLVYDGAGAANADRLKLYKNGVLLTLTFTGTIPASINQSTQVLKLGINAAGTKDAAGYAYGKIYEGKAYSAIEVANAYAKWAKHVTYMTDSKKILPTLANVTAGRISNTDFSVSSGTWAVGDASNKPVTGVAAGAAYKTSKDAFGTWVFKINKTNTLCNAVVRFIALTNGLYNAAAERGYYLTFTSLEEFKIFRNAGGGSITSLLATAGAYAAISTDYWIAISRTQAGVLTVYIKGGAFTNWTLVGSTAADLTYSASNYLVLEENTAAGTKYSNIRHYQGVLDLSTLPND